MLNVSGISTSLDLVIHYIETHHIDILLLTETFLLKGDLFTQWAQHHQYATISGDASKGNGGLTFLIRPHFPHYVHRSTDPTTTQHNKLSIVIGNSLTVHGFYLPPALSFADYQTVLGSVDFNSSSSVICLGDFNTRLGSFTGDTRSTNPRSNYLLNWLTVHQANLWNRISTFGQPTFESNRGTSIIDFVISRPNIFSANPLLSIESDINLNSDHHLVQFSFKLHQQPQLLPTSTLAGSRRLWNLQRLEEKDVFELYRKNFFSNIFKLQQEVKHFMAFQQQQHPNLFVLSGDTATKHRKEATINQRINATNGFYFEVVESPKDFINRIGIETIQAIHSALDNSVTPRTPRPKTWKFFWDAELQHLADIRQQCYTDWKQHKHHRRSLIGSTHLWSLYQQACNNLKKAIKAAKRRHWKKFCNNMSDSSSNQVYSVLKRLRKKHTTNHCFSHSEGPEVAANVMADYQRHIFGGDQLDFSTWRASRSPLHQHTTKPTFFSALAIKQQLSAMGNRKAPGDDHIVKEMLMPIWYPLCNFLSEFFTLCYTFAWTPTSFRSGLIVPIFKKGDPNSAANYRPISLTNTFRKLYERCLKFCLLTHMPSLDVAQGGFRAARSGISQAWNLLALQKQFEQQYGVSPALIFMDISKAYDSVTRSKIWQLLHPHLPKALFYTLRHLFDHVTLNVVINNATSLPIHPKRGLLQGSILSPFLYAIFINQLPALLRTAPVRFPLYVDIATRARTDGDGPSADITEPSFALVKYGAGPRLSETASSCSPRLGVVRQKTAIHSLLYADDVCLIAHRRDMPLLVQLCEEYSLRFDFKWSPTKCALVNYHSRRRPIQLYGINVPIVPSYEYLGVPFNASGIDNIAFLNASTKKAKSTMALFRRLGVHQYGFGLMLALQVYRVFVRPIMEYALALLGLNATSAMAIDRTQASCLKMTLNQSERHNAPSMVLNMMGNLPAMYTRAQILTFKFWYSLQLKARPFTLVECILYTHQRLKIAPALWRRLSSNKIWKLYKSQKSSCLRALREDTTGYDPLLFYPCTRLERLRLIRWRFHHLPSFPLSACRCGAPSANRFHYLAACPLVQDIVNRIHLNLPDDSIPLDESYDDQGIATTHILDRILNSLPSNLSFCLGTHWERTWPLVLELITQIDIANHPAGSFAEEPPSGELFEHYLTQQHHFQQQQQQQRQQQQQQLIQHL
ncbi:Pyrimidine nucleotide transporter, mitochondrial [Mucor velutinosus]|uniref:Pyrimidine nucleotide transporter, mitochondrial n=1 Tax=Mucor velutinosus TaxID=708070 RepID=A0AAN7I3G8_9FUNG|nr:Pyrimidine nucleotide transporter, mitochondrial [Mucor velutinosus]